MVWYLVTSVRDMISSQHTTIWRGNRNLYRLDVTRLVYAQAQSINNRASFDILKPGSLEVSFLKPVQLAHLFFNILV